MIIFLLQILLMLAVTMYFASLLIIWHYEIKKAKIYRLVLEEIELLRNLGLSMAMFHAKMFKLEQDYQQWLKTIEARQQFIIEKMLFFRKSSSKIKNENSYCFQV